MGTGGMFAGRFGILQRTEAEPSWRALRHKCEGQYEKREESKKPDTATQQISRRETAKKIAKMAYVVPAILSVVKTTERPAFAQSGPPTTQGVPSQLSSPRA